MEEPNEEEVVALADAYAESRMQFFKPWEGSYRLACKNAFVNAYVAGYQAKRAEINPEVEDSYIIPIEPKCIDYEQIE